MCELTVSSQLFRSEFALDLPWPSCPVEEEEGEEEVEEEEEQGED